MSRGPFQFPCPCGEPLLTHTSTGGPPNLTGHFGSFSYGVTAPLLWILVCTKFFCALQDWSLCFSQISGSSIIKSHWPLRPDSLGIPSPFVRSPGWEAWRGVQNLRSGGRTSLVVLFSSLWVAHLAGMGFDFIVICPSYHIAVTSSLSFDMEHLFLVGSRVLLLVVVQLLVVTLELS